jgi:hypothetical protein
MTVNTKLLDAPYSSEVISRLKENEVIEVNITSMIVDFERVYAKVLLQEFDWPIEEVSRLKSDLFAAFAYGCVNGLDNRTELRRRYKFPKSFEQGLSNLHIPKKPSIIY